MDKIEVMQADRTLYHQLLSLGSVNLNRRRMGLPIVDGFELIAAHRLATRTDATTDPDEDAIRAEVLATRTDATPVAWLHTLHMEQGQVSTRLTDWDCVDPDEPTWGAFGRPGRDYSEEYRVTTQPLYTHPPATDVAALVEAAKETNAALERDGDPAFAHLILANKAALAPFTKGQNDE